MQRVWALAWGLIHAACMGFLREAAHTPHISPTQAKGFACMGSLSDRVCVYGLLLWDFTHAACMGSLREAAHKPHISLTQAKEPIHANPITTTWMTPFPCRKVAYTEMSWHITAEYILFYKSLLQNIVCFIGLFAKETYNFKQPTHRSHPILQTPKPSINEWPLAHVETCHTLRCLTYYGVDTISRLLKTIGLFCRV